MGSVYRVNQSSSQTARDKKKIDLCSQSQKQILYCAGPLVCLNSHCPQKQCFKLLLSQMHLACLNEQVRGHQEVHRRSNKMMLRPLNSNLIICQLFWGLTLLKRWCIYFDSYVDSQLKFTILNKPQSSFYHFLIFQYLFLSNIFFCLLFHSMSVSSGNQMSQS